MNAASKLLRKICATSLDVCNELTHPGLKIPRILVATLRNLVLKTFRKTTSETLTSPYNLASSMANHATHQEYKQMAMEPYLEYYNSGSSCDMAMTCPNDPQTSCGSDSYGLAMSEDCYMRDRQRYKGMRQWKRFRKEKVASGSEEFFVLRLLSFNILAQHLLESYPYLYKHHDKRALPWEIRRPLLVQEILEAEANVICLQEMQEDHLQDFLEPFQSMGYDYLYKKRTNDKIDGLLLLYRSDQLVLLEHAKVELYQSGIELLSRDNVGIIAKLAVKDSPETQLVIATTHLLYNPRRNDVRLGQTQLLLAEIERIAFLENTMTGPRYRPIILAGDFNLEPYSGVYKFITQGAFEYVGKGKSLEESDFRFLSNSLIPPRLCVTDNCQHFNVLTKRLRGEGNGRVMLENSERFATEKSNDSKLCEVNLDSTDLQTIEIVNGYLAQFSSGKLTHPFKLFSIYEHFNRRGEPEVTTKQNRWITVDYIFYGGLEPVELYSLPTNAECANLPTIPNFAVGSDHLCLGATFKVFKPNY